MPQLFSFGRYFLVNQVSPHFIPFVRSIGSVCLETDDKKLRFSVRAGDHPVQELNISFCTGSQTSLRPVRWKPYLHRYLESNGATDLGMYRDIGPWGNYLVPVMVRFFQHLLGEQCLCFEPFPESQRRGGAERYLDVATVGDQTIFSAEERKEEHEAH